MPIYEYICDNCKKHYEAIVLSPSQKISCPKCSSEKRTMQLSVFAAGKSSSSSTDAAPSCGMGGCMGNPDVCGCN